MEKAKNAQELTEMEFQIASLQLSQAIETFRSQFNLLIQILTVFVVADVTIIGYAVSNQIAGVLLVGALVPLVMDLVSYGAGKFMLPVLYTAVVVEKNMKRYGKYDSLAETFISTLISTSFLDELHKISQIENYDDRLRALRKKNLPLVSRDRFRRMLAVVALMHVATALALGLAFNWPFL